MQTLSNIFPHKLQNWLKSYLKLLFWENLKFGVGSRFDETMSLCNVEYM